MDNLKLYDWTPESMLEVTLEKPDDFLKVRETLTRIGIASSKANILYASCNILHKQGRYFIVHFLEMFALDGKESNITPNDIARRNRIATLLSEWGLLKIVDPKKAEEKCAISEVKILSFAEKKDWQLVSKYTLGNNK